MRILVFNAHLCALLVYFLIDIDITVGGAHIHLVKRADKYTSKYDSFDVEGVLASSRLVKRYGDCLMERGPCPPEGRYLKDTIPDAIATKCSKCNPIQKKQTGLVLQHLLLNYRELFLELAEKYDPSGKARKEYGIDSDDTDYEDLDNA